MKVVIHFCAPEERGAKFQLSIVPYETPIAQKWLGLLKKCIDNKSPILKNGRFYSFPEKNPGRDEMVNGMINAIRIINNTYPNHIPFEYQIIENTNITQDFLNYLHALMVDLKHYNLSWESPVVRASEELNRLIHQYERFLRGEFEGWNYANVRCNYLTEQYPLSDEDYDHFDIGVRFGMVTIDYPHLGKDFLSMAGDNEEVGPINNLGPQSKYWADFKIWLGIDIDQNIQDFLVQRTKNWWERQQIDQYGFTWGDKKNALGEIPVARIETNLNREVLREKIRSHSFIEYLTYE